MSQAITILFLLTGQLAGKTITLGDYQFVEGRCEITDDPVQLALHARALEVNWQALPENDPRHEQIAAAMAELIDKTAEELANEQREIPPGGNGPDRTAEVHGGSEPEAPAADSAAIVGEADAGAPAGGAERAAADADGHQEGVSQDAGQGSSEAKPEVNEKLRNAVLGLDPKVDANWTKDGKPAMKAVEAAYGSAGITRADVEAAAPGFNREAAKA